MSRFPGGDGHRHKALAGDGHRHRALPAEALAGRKGTHGFEGTQRFGGTWGSG